MSLPLSDTLFTEATRADIQGLIASGLGHLPHSAWLFVQFDARERAAARAWLRSFRPQVLSAAPWPRSSDGTLQKPARALNIAFTMPGLAALGLSERCVESFPLEFREGMASAERSQILGDCGESAPEHWHLGGPGQPEIHAAIFLSAATAGELERECELLRVGLAGDSGSTIVHEEFGSQWAEGREPFGFRDGIARVEVKGLKGEGVNSGEFILGHPNEYGFHAVGPVLPAAEDPLGLLADTANPFRPGLREFGLNGSFVVYRKLEQDVASFWQFLEAESVRRQGAADPVFMIWLAAKMVGRWPSGAPLTLAPGGDDPTMRDRDDFLYATADARGFGCPFGAHVRRTNPRDQLRPAGPTESMHMTARHRILRRGKPYGRPLFDWTVLDRMGDREALRAMVGLRDDGQPRGLHFVCVNASIKSQFEFIQQSWANNPHFNGLTGNRDPIIGIPGEANDSSAMVIPTAGLPLRTAPLPRFVTVRGGTYLFMPSLRALTYLAADLGG